MCALETNAQRNIRGLPMLREKKKPPYLPPTSLCATIHHSQNTAICAAAPTYLIPTCSPAPRCPAFAPSGQTVTQVYPVLAAANGSFTSYPPQTSATDDEHLLHTYASFFEEPITGLSRNRRLDDSWSVCIPVPIPTIENPTLLSLSYLLKYASSWDDGNATIQTDTILAQAKLNEGVTTEITDLVYRSRTKYGPRVVNRDTALCLSTTLGVKCNGGGDRLSHYVESQNIAANVRVVEAAQLYVVIHFAEYPTRETIRSLAVEVSATWQKEEVELKAKAKAKRLEEEAVEKKRKEEGARQAKEEEERKEREEAKLAREEERREREAAKEARAEEKKERDEAKQAREEERITRQKERLAREQGPPVKPSVEHAPQVADTNMQKIIKERMTTLGLTKCDQGYEFVKTETGYQCKGGGHKVTFEQLGM
ncbi:hypothetical protein C8R43DRAFT_1043105, partial [Mycena crocata]